MGGGLIAAKPCDSCKSSTASVFCRADAAFLCSTCDANIHAANKLASRHPRVWVCEVCEQSPATVTCKADAAHLCPTCDRDIHSANPLARRHDRVPLLPFFDHLDDDSAIVKPDAAAAAAKSAAINKLFGEEYYSDADEAEAASWLLPNCKGGDEEEPKSIDYFFGGDGVDQYLEMDFGGVDPKADPSGDGVVPDPDEKEQQQQTSMYSLAHYNHNFDNGSGGGYDSNLKHFTLSSFAAATATQPSLSHSVSSSSMEFGVVPDANAMGDVASTGVMDSQQMKIMAMDREARVLRYREKRKNRKFEKTIRYASRKAYAETRPRIKGRFAKRSDVEADAVVSTVFGSDSGYGLVPSF